MFSNKKGVHSKSVPDLEYLSPKQMFSNKKGVHSKSVPDLEYSSPKQMFSKKKSSLCLRVLFCRLNDYLSACSPSLD